MYRFQKKHLKTNQESSKMRNSEIQCGLSATSQFAVFVTGAPATGKSTLVEELGKVLDASTVHIGQTLREIASAGRNPVLRETVRELLSTGSPMPFGLYHEILANAAQDHLHRCVIIDGYPRSLEQCNRLPEILEIINRPMASIVGLVLEVSRETSLARTIGRQVCLTCHSSVSLGDQCCAKMVFASRPDDQHDLLLRRHDSFLEISPLIETTFKSRWPLHRIDASRKQDQVAQDAVDILRRYH
jgi:adenylate kinase family enzyme